jgi:hypothetical protein
MAPGRGTRGAEALYLAARAGPQPLVAALLRAGADPSIGDGDGSLSPERATRWSAREAPPSRAARWPMG